MDSNYIVSCDVKYFKKLCSYQNTDLQTILFQLNTCFFIEFASQLIIIMSQLNYEN